MLGLRQHMCFALFWCRAAAFSCQFVTLSPSATTVLGGFWMKSSFKMIGCTLGGTLGKRLYVFHLDVAPLPLCSQGSGACAIWEGSSGRVVLDASVAHRIASSYKLGNFMHDFSLQMVSELENGGPAIAQLPAHEALSGAAVAALAALALTHLPFWWCVACPLTLGMLAPFVFNFGLTAAAEELCGALQLPDDECSDLW
jgi:hypothetical protein